MIKWNETKQVNESLKEIYDTYALEGVLLKHPGIVENKLCESRPRHVVYKQKYIIAEKAIKGYNTIITMKVDGDEIVQNYTINIAEGISILGTYIIKKIDAMSTSVTLLGNVVKQNNQEGINDFLIKYSNEIKQFAIDTLLVFDEDTDKNIVKGIEVL